MPAQQGRYFILTIPTRYLAEIPQPRDELVWLKGQKEIGAGGLEHWQLVCAFKKKVTITKAKSFFCRQAHVELTRSEAAEEYVNKDETMVEGSRFEYGQKQLKRNSKTDWDAVYEAAKKGDLENIPADVKIRNYTSLKRIAVDHSAPQWREGVTVKVFYGGTGLGKTRKAWHEAGREGVYVKDPCTKWWDGYKGEKKVIIDEFTGMINIAHLLRWLDRYPCMAEIKGFSVPLCATEFWITSNLHPREWYKDITEEQQQALLRRMTLHHFVFEWVPRPDNPNPNEDDTLINLMSDLSFDFGLDE